MMQYEQFSTCLKRILEEEQLSASQTAKLLGMRSRNSIFRILTDQTSVKVQEEFFSTLKGCFQDQWPQRHWIDLERALEIGRMGVSNYMGRNALRSLVQSSKIPDREVLLNVPQKGFGYITQEFRPWLKAMVSDGELMITVCGCCSASLCRLLMEELRVPGNQGRLKVKHFVNMDEDVAVQNVAAIQPLLCFRWYEAMLVEPESCPEEMAAIYSASSIIIEKSCDGKMQYSQLIHHNTNKLYLVALHEEGGSKILRLLNFYASRLPKLKSHFPCSVTVDDYVAYTDQYRALENDKEVLSIKPDVPINYIHPDVLLPAVLDGFKESGFIDGTDMEAYVQQFYDIHMLRFENFRRKRKVTHVVFSQKAMRKFMLTGRQSDHFFAMRPYTLAERLAILNHLREETTNNPYFCVRFLKPDYDHPSMEITLYDGVGVLFTKSDTHYDLAGDHSEALVSHPGFAKKFREFFIHDLLPNHVMSHKDSLAVMNELAREAAKYG